MRYHGATWLSAAPILSASLVANPVYAQSLQNTPVQSAPATPPAQKEADSSTKEIVVTANKREEKLNRVGLTVTAITAQVLADRKVNDLASLATVAPGLSFAQSPSNTPILTLRGVGFDSSALGSYPAVSLSDDQLPLPFPVLASHASFDLERVEVLKGPQGTLFGQNATGGAINFIPAKPTSFPETGGEISYGRFNDAEATAYVSGPLSDTLRARVSGTYEHRDGWQISDSRPGDHNADLNYFVGRAIVDWSPFHRVRFSLTVNGWVDKSQPQAPQFVALVPETTTLSPAEQAAPFSSQSPRAADWTPGSYAPRSDRKFYQVGLRSDIDLTNSLTLTTLTSYDHFVQSQAQDFDGLPILVNNVDENGHIRSFNQEVRLANSPQSPFRWIVGGNYEHSNTFDYQLANISDQALAQNPVTGFDSAFTYVDQNIRNIAGFANGELDLTSKLTAKAGVRYTDSRNSAQLCTGDGGTGRLSNLFDFFRELAGLPLIPTPPGSCLSFNLDGIPDTSPTKLKLDENNVSWRGGLDYKVSNSTLVYANVSRGYKAGSFPLFGAPNAKQYLPVTQESVTAYETGIKTDLFDRRVHLNAAAFYYDYKNKQVLGKRLVDTSIFFYQNALVNIPKSRVAGLETDITIRPVRDLTLSGSATYLDTRVQQYVGFNVVGDGPIDLSGNKLPFAPKFSYNIDLDYRHGMASGGTVFGGASVSGNTGQDVTIGGSDITVPDVPGDRVAPGLVYPFTTKAYALLDLRGGYELPGGKWRVTAYAKNVLNTYYWTNLNTLEAVARFAGQPATYGVTIGFKFR